MGWTTDLVTGVAAYLDTAGVGDWRPTGAYLPGETAITQRIVPISPDRCITLAPYPIGSATPGLADHQVAIQIRVRGIPDDSTDCDDLADAVYDELDGLHDVVLGGVAVVQMWRQSYTSLGVDTNGRWERSENYYADCMRPTVNNPD